MNGEAGKGDKTCPFNRQRWDEGWDRAFGKERCYHGFLHTCDVCYFRRSGGGCDYQGDKK